MIEAVRRTLEDAALDRAFVAEAVLLPSDSFIGDQLETVDPDAVFRAREALRRDLGKSLAELWRSAYADASQAGAFVYSPARQGRPPDAQRRARLYRRERARRTPPTSRSRSSRRRTT